MLGAARPGSCAGREPREPRGGDGAHRGGRASQGEAAASPCRRRSPLPSPSPPRELPGEPVPACRAQAARPPGLRISSEDAESSCPLPSLRFLSLPPPAPPPPRSRPAEIALSVRENNTPPGLPVPAADPAFTAERGSPRAGTTRPSFTPRSARGSGGGGAHQAGPARLAAAPEGREPSAPPRAVPQIYAFIATPARCQRRGRAERSAGPRSGPRRRESGRAGGGHGRPPRRSAGLASPRRLTELPAANGGPQRSGRGSAGPGPLSRSSPRPRAREALHGEYAPGRARRCSCFLETSHRPSAVVGNPPRGFGTFPEAGPGPGPAPAHVPGPAAHTAFELVKAERDSGEQPLYSRDLPRLLGVKLNRLVPSPGRSGRAGVPCLASPGLALQ